MTNNYVKPVIFGTNFNTKGLGIYKSENNVFVVEVFKEEGRASYTYKLDNKRQFISRIQAIDTWELVAEHLGASLVKVDSKWLKKCFKFELKSYKENK